MTIAHPAPRPTTREERALALYRAHGEEIKHLSGAIYRVPSQDGQRSFDVEYGRHEACACPDYLYRGGSCVHILALAIATAKGTIRHPELAAGAVS
jgi:predicted nucleic acid-binding Zn finger protein